MITEDYVNFEVAKLLKEKGFDENTPVNYFVGDDKPRGCAVGEIIYHKRLEEDTHLIACPTLQMAMKWLREVHKECIIVYPIVTDDDGSAGCLWECSILKLLKTQYKSAYAYEFYEQACEEAIRYCLINLI